MKQKIKEVSRVCPLTGMSLHAVSDQMSFAWLYLGDLYPLPDDPLLFKMQAVVQIAILVHACVCAWKGPIFIATAITISSYYFFLLCYTYLSKAQLAMLRRAR